MNMLAFDTHAAVKRLTAHGLTEEQAESIVSVIGASADQRLSQLATKDELRNEITLLRGEMTTGFAELRGEMATGFAELRSEITGVRGEILSSQNKIILWLMGTMIAIAGLTIAAFKLL